MRSRLPIPARIIGGVGLLLFATLAVAIAFGKVAPPAPREARQLDRTGLPPLSRYNARDGTALGLRAYPAGDSQVVVLLHGSATESSVMNSVAKALAAKGATVYALDLRGHGSSGRRGDVDYIGQLDDDIADFVATIRPTHRDAVVTLVGFSAGGALAMRIAGGHYGELFDRYLLVAPAIPYPAPIARPNGGGWAVLSFPRIVGLVILNHLGIHWFDGLETIAFAIPAGSENRVGAYSFRLMMNLANRDYLAALRHTTRPMVLVVGGGDEQFYADRYAPSLKPAKSDLAVQIVPGLGHVDMITTPAGVAAIAGAFERLVGSQGG